MSRVTMRPFHADDVEGVLALWEASARTAGQPVYGLAEVLASCEKDHAVVAHESGRLVGAVVGRAAHAQGWVVFLGTAAGHEGLGPRLLAALEREMTGSGLTKLSALLTDDPAALGAFHRQGFRTLKDLHYLERDLPLQRAEVALLAELGGRMLPRDRWDAIGGMTEEKGLLERRLVIPLAHPDVADRFGVAPPRAVVLFGPPGTGKTTFAKAIASRLEWPFVEVFPSRLAADPAGLAGALRETFTRIAALEHVVVFIDEVEEIAGRRGGEPPSPLQGVTNELLKIIPAFREQPGRLLVCATNFIRAIDGAFLRHGRFDYVLPIGLPDAAARHAIWQAYLPAGAAGQQPGVDLAEVVAHSEGFSPADIEFAARRASQAAMEHALASAGDGGEVGADGGPLGPTTQDYLRAVASTRATVSAEAAAEFEEDITTLARL
ncbi:ATP-binding protein [Quadrisphaera setariae]|uniref:AAA family ATPase n=1 Tax=Quadrisphaera setariae TaxID=2593304 RepID=A0A5C8ZBM1_9ACTN|nr:GNAT family N-acetyltransferase [Quadrisphaera setariae]TXR55167.1 AAA family ATPase [Quadrisphaera setariae]